MFFYQHSRDTLTVMAQIYDEEFYLKLVETSGTKAIHIVYARMRRTHFANVYYVRHIYHPTNGQYSWSNS
jgi:hypothetical protein